MNRNKELTIILFVCVYKSFLGLETLEKSDNFCKSFMEWTFLLNEVNTCVLISKLPY